MKRPVFVRRILGTSFAAAILATSAGAFAQSKPGAKPAANRATSTTRKLTDSEREAKIDAETAERYVNLIQFANNSLQNLRYDQRDCWDCHAASAGETSVTLATPNKAKQCRETWDDYYSKPEIEVGVVFGYMDSDEHGNTEDLVAKRNLIDVLTGRCETNGVRACAFKQSADDADILEKTSPGPDGTPHTIRVRLTASSYSTSERLNKLFALEQKAQSEKAEKAFLGRLESTDMLLYIGHARGGGGPDFKPAIRRANGTTNFDHYTSQKPGMRALEAAFMAARRTPKLVGLFACASKDWRDRMTQVAPQTGVMLNSPDKVAHEVSTSQAYLAIDSMLWQRCEDSFNEALSQITTYAKKSFQPEKLNGFFRERPKP